MIDTQSEYFETIEKIRKKNCEMCVYSKHIWHCSIQISIFNRNTKIVIIRVFHKHL